MSAERRSHGRSPYLTALELVTARSRGAVFGVTEERGPGGVVVPLLRAEIPVCPEWPTAEKAFMAAVEFEQRWNNIFRAYPALEAAVSPSKAEEGSTYTSGAPNAVPRAQGRRKARAVEVASVTSEPK